MFNLKQAKSDSPLLPYSKMLIDSNKEHGLTAAGDTGNYNKMLEENHKNLDASEISEKQLEADRKKGGIDAMTTEAAMDTSEKVYNQKRSDKAYANPFVPTNLLEEAQHQKKVDAFNDVKVDADTDFWDKYVGAQISDERRTKIVSNKQNSQLQNHPDRFKNIDKTMPIHNEAKENAKTIEKKDKVDKMVMASVKDADAMLFHLYLQAAVENRELTKDETYMVGDINSGKARMIFNAK